MLKIALVLLAMSMSAACTAEGGGITTTESQGSLLLI